MLGTGFSVSAASRTCRETSILRVCIPSLALGGDTRTTYCVRDCCDRGISCDILRCDVKAMLHA